MCPLYPIHFILMYAIMLCPLWLFTCVIAYHIPKLGVQYDINETKIRIDQTQQMHFTVFNLTTDDFRDPGSYLSVYSRDPNIVESNKKFILSTSGQLGDHFNGSFNMTGNWLGKTEICINYTNSKNESETIDKPLPVIVLRKDRIIDHIFTGSVIILVSIIYINFGCALDWTYVKDTLKRPIGPVIGFFSQFVIMPLLSYFLGKILFPDSPELQLGMFFTGVSPSGGASNIWTYILGGNVNLSITMTTISTFAAFVMMPLWIFTLGRTIFADSNLGVPYGNIGKFAVALVVPLGIGYLIQRKSPALSKIMVRILKPFAGCLLIFIIIFAIITNTYLFQLLSWRMVVAGLGLPWLGYLFGTICAIRQPPKDMLAIAIETGVQNTGISIFLLRISLVQPEADLTTIVPVAVAVMTPFPLMLLFIVKKLRSRYGKKTNTFDVIEHGKSPESEYLPNKEISTTNYTENGRNSVISGQY